MNKIEEIKSRLALGYFDDSQSALQQAIEDIKYLLDNSISNNTNTSLTNEFPVVTKGEVDLIIGTILSRGIHHPKCNCGVPPSGLDDFVVEVSNKSMECEVFQQELYEWKQLLHVANRTVGLGMAYSYGILVGYFLARPDQLPMTEDKEELSTGDIM